MRTRRATHRHGHLYNDLEDEGGHSYDLASNEAIDACMQYLLKVRKDMNRYMAVRVMFERRGILDLFKPC